ncbi:hypothetical protein yc1106_01431 [Curvularia clavata]|uniref:Heterokaryon incompatibility domain-containing protein n=1 Tax=Curvularia clavata TaxID=95742 RepID=A0A9Q8Z137_CURCL|nr:hypothetical protein yc1106_01431 [Curvularia clavata]
MIDPEQAFQLFMGLDDISHTFFYRVPPEWSMSYIYKSTNSQDPLTEIGLPLAELDQPWDELTLMRTWLSICETKHSNCKQIAIQGSPKRLLDVRAFTSSNDIRLVNSQSVPTTAKYITLSHCWGPPNLRPICTSKATLSDRMLRIRFEDLSMTFKDAVKICRDLGQKYLWIDSLCIIQDDSEDWLQQAAAMASIYGGSYVTLAALSSADSTQGCRTRPRGAEMPKLSRYQDFDFSSQRVRILEHKPVDWRSEHEGCGSNPLRTRAWTLQERDLSLRCINFAQGQLLWQCRTMKGSSELPWHEMIRKHGEVYLLLLKLNQGEDFTSDGPAFQRNHWFGLVEEYSSRNLTNETDKLPALAGLASKFSEQDPGNYLAGIWSDHLPSALLWRTVPPYSHDRYQPVSQFTAFLPRRPQKYRAPSWSWASIDGEISYDCQRIYDCDDSRRVFDSDYDNFKVTGSYYQLEEAFDTSGTPSDAVLRMRGNIAELQISTPLIEGDFFESIRRLVLADGTTMGAIYPDIVDDFRFVRSVYVLSIRSEPFHSSVPMPFSLYGKNDYSDKPESWNDLNLVMGLALLRASSGEIYRRVGLVRWLKKEVFDGTLPVQLSVI